MPDLEWWTGEAWSTLPLRSHKVAEEHRIASPSAVYQHCATLRVALASVRSPVWLIW